MAAFLIDRWGWRTAYVVLGLIVAGIGGPAWLWMRYPEHVGSPHGDPRRRVGEASSVVGASLRSALRDPRLWLLEAGWFLTGLVFMMVTVPCVPFARRSYTIPFTAGLLLLALSALLCRRVIPRRRVS